MCGWNEAGVKAHQELMAFFSKTRKHYKFMNYVSVCGDWWDSNKPTKRKLSKRQKTDSEDRGGEEGGEPNFLQFFEMMDIL